MSKTEANDEREARTFWICHFCNTANFRHAEGLDTCDRCMSEVKTRFSDFGDRMNVSWQREPKAKTK